MRKGGSYYNSLLLEDIEIKMNTKKQRCSYISAFFLFIYLSPGPGGFVGGTIGGSVGGGGGGTSPIITVLLGADSCPAISTAEIL